MGARLPRHSEHPRAAPLNRAVRPRGWGCVLDAADRRAHGRAARAASARLARWESTGNVLPMEATIDSVGRIVVPKPLRDALGLTPGSTVDISQYGAGLQLVPTGRTARLVDESGVLVATGETAIDDDVVFGLIDAGRR
jgi:AbrB family looped-hinge helix DNA binding protein